VYYPTNDLLSVQFAMMFRAAVLSASRNFEVRSFPAPTVSGDSGLLRVEMTGLCGTDRKIFHGDMDAALPLVLGHEVLGVIEQIGDLLAARTGLVTGDRVVVNAMLPCWSCPPCWSGSYRQCASRRIYGVTESIDVAPSLWGGFAEAMFIAPGSILHPVPRSVPLEAGVMLGVLANGIDWVLRRGGVTVGDTVLIQGAGPQGVAAALVAKRAGAAQVVITGLPSDGERLSLANRITGATTLTVREDMVADLLTLTDGKRPDVVVDVSGSTSALESSVRAVRTGGRVVAAGLVGDGRTMALDVDDLVWRDITLLGSLGKDFDSFSRASDLLPAVASELAAMVTRVFSLDEAQAALEALDDPLTRPMKVAIVP
jgi:threonine dehydrogenase-like Zn-dependent dehydrogenase